MDTLTHFEYPRRGITPEQLIKMSESEFVTKDTGQRQTFDTGAVRDVRGGKGRYDLIPPAALRRLAGVYERGAVKYSEHNWRKGMPMSRCLDSAIRHTYQYVEGHRDEDHLAQAVFNLMAVIEYDELIKRGALPETIRDTLPEIKCEKTSGAS